MTSFWVGVPPSLSVILNVWDILKPHNSQKCVLINVYNILRVSWTKVWAACPIITKGRAQN